MFIRVFWKKKKKHSVIIRKINQQKSVIIAISGLYNRYFLQIDLKPYRQHLFLEL